MAFYRNRRSCVLLSSIVITFPLYLLIFLFYKVSIPGFYEQKIVRNKDIETYDILPTPVDDPYFMGTEPEPESKSGPESKSEPEPESESFSDSEPEPEPDPFKEEVTPKTDPYMEENTSEKHVEELSDEKQVTDIVDISGGELLEDVDESEVKPHPDLSATQIFFVETSHPEGGFLDINGRESCAIESAAQMHPNYNIYVLFAGMIAIDPDGNCTNMVRNLLETNRNVHFRRLDVEKFTEGTPMEAFFKSGKYKNSKHLSVHLADILRLVALWKYGGLYFDLDVVVVKNHAKLGENFLGQATDKMLMSGTMQFGGHGIGHTFVDECLIDLAKHFRGGSWAGNGPDLVTRRMQKFCGTKNVTEMLKEDCQGMRVLPKRTFLPIWYPSHKLYFSVQYAKAAVKAVEKSYTAHIFNHMNHHLKLNKGSKAGYMQLAEKYCPVVYDSLDFGDPF